VTVYEGSTSGAGRHVAIVAARFHDAVTTKLVDGALRALEARGVHDDGVDVVWVPGAFEIPFVARRLAATGRYQAVICLGVIVRGETKHFDLVAEGAADGIARAARDTGVPVIFEVLGVDELAVAEARAGGAHGNRGWDAAETALRMASLVEALPAAEGQEGP
jgi:6,7-dimethyl-8-ribityllumazine synthase